MSWAEFVGYQSGSIPTDFDFTNTDRSASSKPSAQRMGDGIFDIFAADVADATTAERVRIDVRGRQKLNR